VGYHFNCQLDFVPKTCCPWGEPKEEEEEDDDDDDDDDEKPH